MNGAFYIGGIGLTSQQNALDTIANNIANMNTRSFKRSDVRFSEIMSSNLDNSVVRANLVTAPSVAGVTSHVQAMINEQGVLENTNNAMDIAVDGDGFIELMGPRGDIILWRGGSLNVDEEGMLTADNGMMLKSMINVATDVTDITIREDGEILGRMSGEDEPVDMGQIMLVRVQNPNSLERLDGGFYRVSQETEILDTMPGEDGSGRIVQGAVERSNVNLNTEMVDMMIVQRAYAANAQIVQAADQMLSIANNLRR